MLKRTLPLAITIATGLLTLVALLFQLSPLSNLLLSWASFLAAIALVLGVLNLLAVHLTRTFRPGESGRFYSTVLVLSMLLVFALALTDARQLTENGVATLFNWVQAPLEASFAALLAFVLLFSGFQLLKRQRTLGALLFITTAVFTLLYHLLANNLLRQPLPDPLHNLLLQLGDWLENIVVTAGMRGLLIGIALGTITLSLRILAGWERPYQP